MGDLIPSFQGGDWLGTNTYSNDIIPKLKREFKTGTAQPHDGADLARYLAASTILHCFDGWNYLGAATARSFRGDWKGATHFAYYAELRAAISVLAGMGVGVFNGYNISVDSHMRTHWVKGGTHDFVWDALKEWATFNDVFPLGGIPVVLGSVRSTLKDWLLTAFGSVGGATAVLLVADLMKSWSIDLGMMAKDRALRNAVSYDAFVNVPTRVDTNLNARVLMNYWKGFEPGGAGSLRNLDHRMLRLALRATHQAVTGSTTGFSSFADSVLANFRSRSDPQFGSELNFLCADYDSGDLIFLLAADHQPASPNGVLPVLSRALLLLRLATAACYYHYGSNSVTWADVDFWWLVAGCNLGIWEDGRPPGALEDLWDDVLRAITDLDADLKANPATDTFALWATPPRQNRLRYLSEFQRAGLWSLGLA